MAKIKNNPESRGAFSFSTKEIVIPPVCNVNDEIPLSRRLMSSLSQITTPFATRLSEIAEALEETPLRVQRCLEKQRAGQSLHYQVVGHSYVFQYVKPTNPCPLGFGSCEINCQQPCLALEGCIKGTFEVKTEVPK